MKILIPGGHLTPALGLIDWIIHNHPDTQIVFAGRIYSQGSLKQKAIEAYEVKKRSVPFIPFKAVKLEKANFFSWLIKPFRFLLSLAQAYKIIREHQPNVIMSFGGYVAVPFVIAGRFCRIPSLTHEGTRVVGLANKIIFYFSSKIAYSYSPENYNLKRYQHKLELTGTPLRQAITSTKSTPQPSWIKKINPNDKILLILGGNQGSKVINDLIKSNLEWIIKDYIVVHQCGRSNKLYNYASDLLSYAQNKNFKAERYYVREWIDEEDLAWLYQHASLALSRAGANTIEELVYHQLPSILIPLPHSHFDEQMVNAKHLSVRKAAYLLIQDNLNHISLKSALVQVTKNRQIYIKNLKEIKTSMQLGSEQKIYNILVSLSQ
jgi:UDP-N-acetylglucosamine--N-acetylmuramyl-(pentapeptide) pyrophosphoryl-undecaprenol N-acetylglucosamine transferase